MADKYNATWVSHSSMGDFMKCPRAYFLKNIYKDNGTKITIASPALSLGSTVHNVVESLGLLASNQRFNDPEKIVKQFEQEWQKVSGEKGGFLSVEQEQEFFARGKAMIEQVIADPKVLTEKRVLLPDTLNGMLPNFYLSEEENIILCGKIDWLYYHLENGQAVISIYDFKTNKGGKEEEEESLQLPIYQLLLIHYINRLRQEQPNKKSWWQENFMVDQAFYWYLESGEVKQKELPLERDAFEKVFAVAQQVNAKRQELNQKTEERIRQIGDRWQAKEQVVSEELKQKNIFQCPRGEAGCYCCRDLEKVLRGEAKFVGMQYYDQNDKKGSKLFLVV